MVTNLEYYKVFYYVAKTGSLTSAAGLLSISQPAVSQSVKQLEDQLSVKLFTRVSKGIKLTTEGELLYNYVKTGYEHIILGEQKLKQLQDLELGEIKIGASDMTLQFFLLPYLEKFHEMHPAIKVKVSNAPTPETLQGLKDDQIDFGIVTSPIVDSDDLVYTPVKEIEDIFICGRRFTSYKNRTLDLSELERLPLICLEGNTSTRHYMDHFLEEHHVSITPEFELATSDMIVQFTLRNLGVGCVVKDFALPYLANGRLFALRFNEMIPRRQICMVTAAKNSISPAAKALIEIIRRDRT